MKVLTLSLFFFFIFSANAAPLSSNLSSKILDRETVVYEKYYQTRSNPFSYQEYLEICKESYNSLDEKVNQVSQSLEELEVEDFSISHFEQRFRELRQRDGNRNIYDYGFLCASSVKLSNESHKLSLVNSPLLYRLSRDNWSKACDKFVDENRQKDGLLYQQKTLGWSLLQGRYCFVNHLEVLPKTLQR